MTTARRSAVTLFDALELKRGVTAVIGGGGKTTLINALARQMPRSIICTTTKILWPEGIATYINPSTAELLAGLSEHSCICVAARHSLGKLIAPDMSVKSLAALADYVFVEADGSRGLPLKAHESYEPVIPEDSQVVYVLGIDGIGKPISQAAHRPELYTEKIGALNLSHRVTPKDANSIIPDDMRLFINKADDEASLIKAQEIASNRHGLTVIGALAYSREVIEIWRDKRICL